MGKDTKEFDGIIKMLENSKTEDEILFNLTKIVKGFGISVYKDMLLANPYYRDLLKDVKKDVLMDISKLRVAITEEIEAITDEIKKSKDSKKLEELRKDCIFLITEIDQKEKEIQSLI